MNRKRGRQISTCDAKTQTPRFDQDIDYKRDHIVGRQRQIRHMRLFLFIPIDIHVDSIPNIRQQLIPALQNRQRQRRIEMIIKLKIGAIELGQRGHKLRLNRSLFPLRYKRNPPGRSDPAARDWRDSIAPCQTEALLRGIVRTASIRFAGKSRETGIDAGSRFHVSTIEYVDDDVLALSVFGVAFAERVGEFVDGLEINMAALAKTHFQHVQRAFGGDLLGGYRADHVEGVAGGTGRGRGRGGSER